MQPLYAPLVTFHVFGLMSSSLTGSASRCLPALAIRPLENVRQNSRMHTVTSENTCAISHDVCLDPIGLGVCAVAQPEVGSSPDLRQKAAIIALPRLWLEGSRSTFGTTSAITHWFKDCECRDSNILMPSSTLELSGACSTLRSRTSERRAFSRLRYKQLGMRCLVERYKGEDGLPKRAPCPCYHVTTCHKQ